MIRGDMIWRMKLRRGQLALLVALPLLVCCEGSAALAQAMRSPNLNVAPRIPHIDPNIAGRAVTGVMGDSNRIRPDCSAASRDAGGSCSGQAATSVAHTAGKGSAKDKASRGTTLSASLNLRVIANEIVAEIDGTLSDAQADALARRHGLRRIESRSFELIGATIGLFRITGGKTLEAASREFAQDGNVRSVQPNFRYVLQDQGARPSESDPSHYAVAELRLTQAHTLVDGANVTIAVIDSGIDLKHPEFSGVTITPFDALDSKEGPHPHGTGVAGAIVSHLRVMGSAPAAHILAIRAFGPAGKGAESSSYVILKGFDLAASHGAQVVNMSFAGPKDALIGRGLSALAARNIVMVAAAGNAGPKSPPLYPAADASVIAVSATDAQDKLFAASNRGSYIALAAPGVDLFLPAPDDKYQITSGTSFSSAYVSGLAALVLGRNPSLKPSEVRAILTKTARDLGPPGPDDQFGAGEADAFAAVSAVPVSPMPVAAVPEKPASPDMSEASKVEQPGTRGLPVTTMAAEKPANGESRPDMGQSKPETP
jgi:Subtilase family